MTFFNDPHIPRFEFPDDLPEAAPDYCMECDTYYRKDDGENCHCNCQDCGEELPVDDGNFGHCHNCCECDTCNEAYEVIEKHHEATGEWKDMPVITCEKVFSQ